MNKFFLIAVALIPLHCWSSDQLESFAAASEIYSQTKQNPFAYHDEYRQSGDALINYLFNSKAGISDEKERIKGLYETDRNEGKLSSSRIVFLSLQVAMALTPVNRRAPAEHEGDVEAIIASLQAPARNKAGENFPAWMLDFDTVSVMKNAHFGPVRWAQFLSDIDKCSLYFYPYAMVGQKAFSPKQYLEALSYGLFLYGVDDSTKNGVHGGIFDTPITKTVHDLLHLVQQLLGPGEGFLNLSQYIQYGLGEQNQYVATAWKNIAAAVVSALDDNNPALTHEEKSKLEVLSFLMLHETSATIKDTCGFYADEPLASKMLQVANVWHEIEIPGFVGADDEMEFYYSKALETIETITKQCGAAYRLRSLTRDEITPFTSKLIVIADNGQSSVCAESTLKGRNNFNYFKSFRRDTAHLLRRAKIWQSPTEKLGVSYKISEVKATLDELYNWLCIELADGSKLNLLFADFKANR